MLQGDCYSFFYPLSVTLAATLNIEALSQVQLQQDLDFELCSIQFVSTGNFSIQFGTGPLYFMSDFVRASNVLGTGVLPHRFVQPYRFLKGSVMAVKLRNDTANSNTVLLCFEGIHTT